MCNVLEDIFGNMIGDAEGEVVRVLLEDIPGGTQGITLVTILQELLVRLLGG